MNKGAVTRKWRAEKNRKMRKGAVCPSSNHHEAPVKLHQLFLISGDFDAVFTQIKDSLDDTRQILIQKSKKYVPQVTVSKWKKQVLSAGFFALTAKTDKISESICPAQWLLGWIAIALCYNGTNSQNGQDTSANRARISGLTTMNTADHQEHSHGKWSHLKPYGQ